MSRTPRALLGALIVAGAIAFPVIAPAAAPVACAAAVGDYALAGRDPAAFAVMLDPAYYEVGVEATTYGPGPGTPVPWGEVAAWVAAHPPVGVTACGVDQGWTLAEVGVRGGYAYVMLSPSARVAKLYLSSTPIPWD
jgi:hypothetical protein